MPDALSPEPRLSGRPFRPGQSGNPAGRAKGVPNKMTALTTALLDGAAEDIVKAVIASAKAGDATAMRLCVERIMPLRRGAPVLLDLPPITAASDVPKAMAAIVEAVSTGVLSPEEGASVAGIVEANRKAIETADLESRIAALEANNAD